MATKVRNISAKKVGIVSASRRSRYVSMARARAVPGPQFRDAAAPVPPSLQRDAFERMGAERALFVAFDIAAHRLEHGRMRQQQFRRLVMLDLLHALVEFGARGLIGKHARLDQEIVVFG